MAGRSIVEVKTAIYGCQEGCPNFQAVKEYAPGEKMRWACRHWQICERVVKESADFLAEHIQEKAQERWIPIEEQEPPGADHVLVTLKWSNDDYEVCEFCYGSAKAGGHHAVPKVIAWMPLPKPYRK